MEYVLALESALGKSAIKNFLPIQPGDMPDTHADVSELVADFRYSPQTEVLIGIQQFADWYKAYFN